jgi:NAD+ diphosphatase
MSGSANDTINFMTGSPLNRLSWLRSHTKFVNATCLSPSTRWLLYRSGDPLVYKQSGRPVELSTKRIEKLLGPIPYFGQGKEEGESAPEDGGKGLASARIRGTSAVFLGVWEGRGGDDSLIAIAGNAVKGDAYFALDVSSVEKDVLDSIQLPESTEEQSESEMFYAPARIAASRFDKQHAAIYASAKAMMEWNSRIKVSKATLT